MSDPVLLSRLQFAITIGFHFLFPPISIGLAWLLVIVEWRAWRTGEAAWQQAGRFFSKLLALTFAIGVATGIVMEFQFGTNWSAYARFVGDIFGIPLAAEGIFAFFLESSFLGLYLFGRQRVSPAVHWLAILMVALGATLSAFWIIAANSWQHTPAGFVINQTLGRAELTDFRAAVFNPSTGIRYFHTMLAALVAGSFFMAGVSAAILRREPANLAARKSLKTAVVAGLLAAVLVAFPTGHEHARLVAHTQPEKFAAMEGLYVTQREAPLVTFGLVRQRERRLAAKVELPIRGLLSMLAFGDPQAEVKGIDAFPADRIPPLWLTFVSFHNMVLLGMYFIAVLALAALQLLRGRLWTSRKLLAVLMWSLPLPLAACEFGWAAAEVGRQPWVVYHVLLTRDAVSPTLEAGSVWFSILMFGTIYLLLLGLYLFLLRKETRHAPAIMTAREVG